MVKDELIEKSVGGNIFRAFTIEEQRGSDIYRAWASRNFNFIVNDLKVTNSQKYYDSVVFYYTNSLINYWASKVHCKDEKVGYGPASKLFNLLVKAMQRSTIYRRERVNPYLHVPFDKYTLLPLRIIINDIAVVNYKIQIPSNATMGYIINKELYTVIHSAVTRITKTADADRIIYDYWAWDGTH